MFENLDLTPIRHILWTRLHRNSPGRTVDYDPEWDLRALMLRQLLLIPYMKDLVKHRWNTIRGTDVYEMVKAAAELWGSQGMGPLGDG